MATISLRVYNREIENLIETGKLDQAIAHCQHILKSYSMHIGTYQLLGKAYLEAHRFVDATDIFQRILNAVPDDFISHVGMSIIRDDENKLNDSIWHMERAYEVQPSNPAIQGELRRLYGKRDGVEPAKIRLSREALANMYAQGELYNQAIAEIRAVLTEDPERPDLQVMLARAYYQTGQKVEAAEMAAHLLKKYPYCADALRVLVEVLPGSANSENIQIYRQRLKLLDPYSPYTTNTVFHTEQVSEDSVTLEKLEYIPETPTSSGSATWASNLGINLNNLDQQEITPRNNEIAPPVESSSTSPGQEPISHGKESTETEASGEVQEISKADLPEWLREQVPTDLEMADIKTDETTTSDNQDILPDWLTNLNQEEPSETTSTVFQPGVEFPATLEVNQPEAEVVMAEQEIDNPSIEMAQEVVGGTEHGDEGFDSWLEKLAGSVGAGTQATLETAGVDQSTPETNIFPSNENILDLSERKTEGELSLGTEPVDIEPAGTPLPFTGDSKVSEPDLKIEKGGDIPDWIHSLAVESESKVNEQQLNEMQSSPNPVEEINPIPPQKIEGNLDNIPDWLKEINKDQLPVPEAVNIEQKVDSPQVEVNVPEPNIDEETHKLALKIETEEANLNETKIPEEDASITAWLKRLDETSSGKIDQKTEPEVVANTEEDLPVWLRNLEKEKGFEAEIPEIINSSSQREQLDWESRRVESDKEQAEQLKAASAKEIDWVEDDKVPGKQAPPTIPGEWIPEQEQDDKPIFVETPSQGPESPSAVQDTALIENVPSSLPVVALTPSIGKDTQIFTNAHNFLQSKQVNEAAQEYLKLIKKGKHLSEVIEELLQALELYSDNSLLWQTLGDGYMRSNRLKDALDAYSKAESFLM